MMRCRIASTRYIYRACLPAPEQVHANTLRKSPPSGTTNTPAVFFRKETRANKSFIKSTVILPLMQMIQLVCAWLIQKLDILNRFLYSGYRKSYSQILDVRPQSLEALYPTKPVSLADYTTPLGHHPIRYALGRKLP